MIISLWVSLHFFYFGYFFNKLLSNKYAFNNDKKKLPMRNRYKKKKAKKKKKLISNDLHIFSLFTTD